MTKQVSRVRSNGHSEISVVRCSECGRFICKGYIRDGEMYLPCPSCKAWTVVLGRKQDRELTSAQIDARVEAR